VFDIFIKLSDILALNAIAIGDLMGAINKGENISLQNLINDVFIVGVGWKSEAAQIDIDVSAFLINEQGKVTNDEDFIFYNKLESKCGSVQLNLEPTNSNKSVFYVDLSKIPTHIQRLVFVLTAADANGNPANFNQLNDVVIRLVDDNEERINYELNDIQNESSVIMGEIYRHKEIFKFRAVGQGFNNGLSALATHFGVDVLGESIQENKDDGKQTSLKRRRRSRAMMLAEYSQTLLDKMIAFFPKITAAIESSANESNTRMILDRFFIDVLEYDIDDVKAEQNIQGRRADYVLSVDGQDVIVVEVKKAGMALRDKQIFQATSYGAYSGIRWALLTNLLEWQLYRISTHEKVEADLVFSLKFSATISLQDVERMALLSRPFLNHKNIEIERLWRDGNALSVEIIGGILLTDDIVSKVRSIIKRDTDCNVTNEQVRVVVERMLNLN
jgi:stress response protein SCP2